MMRRCLSLFAVMALSLASVAGADARARTVELSATSTMYETHPVIAKVMLPWFKAMEEASGGRLKFSYFGPGTVCPVNEIYPSVAAGIVDIGQSSLSMTPGRYPLFGMVELPMTFDSCSQFAVVSQKLYEKYPELRQELKGLVPISFAGSVPLQIVSLAPVRTLDDLKGKKVGTTVQAAIEPLAAFGANPISIAPTDCYMSLQRGMIDAIAWPIPSISSFKLQEVAKYVTLINLSTATSYTFFSEDAWNSLPGELRDILLPSMGLRGTLSYSTCSDLSVAEHRAMLEKEGVTFITPAPAEMVRFEEAARPSAEKWLADMEKKGFAGIRAMYADMLALAAEYDEARIEELRRELKPYNQ